MKITLVSGTYPPELNGVAYFVKTLAHELIKQGHEVQLIISSPYPERVKLPEGSSKNLLIKGKVLKVYRSVSFTPEIPYQKVKEAIKTFNPDVVHINTIVGVDIAALKVARELGVPTVFTFHTHYELFVRRIAHFLLGKISKLVDPAVDTIFGRWVYRYSELFDAVVAPTDYTRRILEAHGVTNVFTIENPVTVVPETKKSWEKTGRVLHVGRLSYEKRLDVLLRVAKLLPGLEFVITSKGAAEKYYHRLASALGLKNVVFTGFLPDKELARIYATADLFFTPAKYDTFNIAGAQAMAAALPVVAHREGGIGAMVEEASGGFTVAHTGKKEIEAFAEAIRILEEDEGLRRKFGINNQWYSRKFNPAKVANRYAKLYSLISPIPVYSKRFEYLYRVGLKLINAIGTLIPGA